MDEQKTTRVEPLLAHKEIAQLCHDANASMCRLHGDYSQVLWEAAPEWQRASAINGIKALAEDNTMSPAQVHESWAAQKIADGWTYGPVKDPDNKTHPCLVPYDHLPEDQRLKDVLYRAIALAFLGVK